MTCMSFPQSLTMLTTSRTTSTRYRLEKVEPITSLWLWPPNSAKMNLN